MSNPNKAQLARMIEIIERVSNGNGGLRTKYSKRVGQGLYACLSGVLMGLDLATGSDYVGKGTDGLDELITVLEDTFNEIDEEG